MNICTCCYDEATGVWCGCEDTHTVYEENMEDFAHYLRTGNEPQHSEQWSYVCDVCDRYTSGTVFYTD